MPVPIPVIVSWSGGKDSALALHAVLNDHRFAVHGLLTSVNQHYGRISMHGVREALLDMQAETLNLPVFKLRLTQQPSNQEYEDKLRAELETFKARGISHMVYGDLFLEDIRKYREANLAQSEMRGLFPLWQRSTAELAREFISLGFRAVLCCVDEHSLDGSFAGREYDTVLLQDLPAGVDPCGENGEFHTFVYAGPIFRRPIAFKRTERIRRENCFRFCDLIPMETHYEHLASADHRR